MNEEFLSIPPHIWKGIFSLLKVLGAGLLLGIFASRYQKRKEIELQVKASVLKLQLQTYVRLNSLLSRIMSVIAPPLTRESFFQEIINSDLMGIRYMEYPSFFDSIDAFDSYYKELVAIHNSEHIYMQYTVERKLQELIHYLSEIKMMLDAFCDTEHTVGLLPDMETADVHIRTGVQITGICIQNDLLRFHYEMDRILSHEISHISLSYRSHYLKTFRERVQGYIWSKRRKWKLPASGNSILAERIPVIVTYLAYVHFSHIYTPQEWYRLPKETVKEKLGEFHTVFLSNMHHG